MLDEEHRESVTIANYGSLTVIGRTPDRPFRPILDLDTNAQVAFGAGPNTCTNPREQGGQTASIRPYMNIGIGHPTQPAHGPLRIGLAP